MVWAGICFVGGSKLRIIDRGSPITIRYRYIFDSIVITFASAIGDDFVLMHENIRPQDACMVQWYMEEA